MTVATQCHVDDIITRGARAMAATVEFWTMVAARFPVKEWNIVEFDNPVTYCAKRISKIQKCGKVWYTMDQTRDIEVFLTDASITGVRATAAPMPYKSEMVSSDVRVIRNISSIDLGLDHCLISLRQGMT